MIVEFNTVKSRDRLRDGGGLRAKLVFAGLEIVEEVGLDAFPLRAAARRAGVSAAAPAHYFGDTPGLLTAIATLGFVAFGDALEAATGQDRRSTILAQCHAYLRFALARPSLFRLMWRKEMLDLSDPEHVAAAQRSFAVYDRVVRPGVPPAAPSDPALAPTIAGWALIHGFVGLMLDGAFFSREEGAPGALNALLDAALAHLEVM